MKNSKKDSSKKTNNLTAKATKGAAKTSEAKETAKTETTAKEDKKSPKNITLIFPDFNKLQPLNMLNHTFSKNDNLIFENMNFGYKRASLQSTPDLLKIIDAWHFIENLLLIKRTGKKLIFATSFILNELILNNLALTDANIMQELAEYNKKPENFLFLEYMQDLESSEIKPFADSLNLGQNFSNFSHSKAEKLGGLLEIKAEYDKDYVPAMLYSRNDSYDLLLMRTRDGFNLGIFPMIDSYKSRNYDKKRWISEDIKEMSEIIEKYHIDISEAKEKISKKALAQEGKEQAAKDKEANFNKNFAAKLLHIETAKNSKELASFYTEAIKKDFAGSISKALQFELNKAKNELKAIFKADEDKIKAEAKIEKSEKKNKKELAKAIGESGTVEAGEGTKPPKTEKKQLKKAKK